LFERAFLHFLERKNHRATREIFNAASETISVETQTAFCEDGVGLVPIPVPRFNPVSAVLLTGPIRQRTGQNKF
jgi:hypothetical protein